MYFAILGEIYMFSSLKLTCYARHGAHIINPTTRVSGLCESKVSMIYMPILGQPEIQIENLSKKGIMSFYH